MHCPLIALSLKLSLGGGKTTITTFLRKLFVTEGYSCAIASTDDFYLTNAQQRALAKEHDGNRLLEYRGNPGTVDVDLMCDTVSRLKYATEDSKIAIPRYDKSAFEGRGDRAPEDTWPVVQGHTDLIILEGW